MQCPRWPVQKATHRAARGSLAVDCDAGRHGYTFFWRGIGAGSRLYKRRGVDTEVARFHRS
eukprot:6863466-Pyramimonas_sp.AAC.1